MKYYSVVRCRIDNFFENLGYFLHRNAIICSMLIVPMVVYFAAQVPQLRIESSVEDYLQNDDPALLAYTNFQNQFGSGGKIIVGIATPNLFSHQTLNRLQNFQRELELRVPHISKVKSLTNALYIDHTGDNLIFGITGDLIAENRDITHFEEVISSSRLYNKKYLSDDRQLAILSLSLVCPSVQSSSLDVLTGLLTDDISLINQSNRQICSLSGKENNDMIAALKLVRDKYQQDDFQIHLTGSPVLRQFTGSTMKKDVTRFLLLSVLVIAILLYLLFKSLPGLLFPLIIVFCSVSSTIGLMVLLNIPFQPPTKILPSFLITVGVGASVHIMLIFYQFLNQGFSKKNAIAKTLGHSGMPIVLTSITTAAGLASFSTAEVVPIANLGYISALGVFISLFYTILLLPVLLSIFPVKNKTNPFFIRHFTMISVVADKIVKISTGYPKTIVVICSGLFIISCMGISQLKIVYNPLLRLPEHAQLLEDTKKITALFPGIATVEMLVDTKVAGGLTDPETVRKFKKLFHQISQYSTDEIAVYNIFSIFDVIQEIHKNLTPATGEKMALPTSSSLMEQELLILESGSPDFITLLTDTSFQLSRIIIQAPWTDAMAYQPFLSGLETLFKDIFKEDASVTLTGIIPLMTRTISATITSMIKSYLFAVLIISVAIIVFLGHLRLGILSMFPNLLPIFLTLGYMGWQGIPLDMYTLLIGSIALGLVVDDTIHFMFNFRRYYNETANVASAVKMTLESSGLAMLVTTIVLACGSFIFMASEMRSLYYFGLLTGMTIVTALLADFFLIPALLTLYYRREENKF